MKKIVKYAVLFNTNLTGIRYFDTYEEAKQWRDKYEKYNEIQEVMICIE